MTMNNVELLQDMLKRMSEDEVDLDTMNSGLLTSIATSLAVTADKALEQEFILDKIRAEIEKQEKWLKKAGYTICNVDIAFDTIKEVIAESK